MAPNAGFEVFLKYLPSSADEAGVAALFGECGDISGGVRLMRDSRTGNCKGVGWITFATSQGADAAVAMSGLLYDGRHVEVSQAKQTSWVGGHAATVGGVTGTLQVAGTHTPAMASDVVRTIVGEDTDAVFVDGTFGRGGHSRAILAALGAKGSLHAFDLDPEALDTGKQLSEEDRRFVIHRGGFASMAEVLGDLGLRPAGVFLDLGISSPQLDDMSRGFRPEQEGPLDLRFDLTSGETASDFLRRASRAELLQVFSLYGDLSDPHAARRVADAICIARGPGGAGCPTTTRAFANLVAAARGYEYQAMHAAKATFQALRIHINDEFGQLRGGMVAALKILRPGGRLGVLTWKHSECALLVEFLRSRELAPHNFPLLKWYQAVAADEGGVVAVRERWGLEADSACRPSADELRINSRARSAVLHILRKKRGLRCADLEAAADATFGWADDGTGVGDKETGDKSTRGMKRRKRKIGTQ